MKEYLTKKNIIIGGSIITFLIIFTIIFIFQPKDKLFLEQDSSSSLIVSFQKYVSVDIKGYVKNPGVYLMEENNIIKDVIEKSGGITKSGSTKNINLAKRVTDEMVIIIPNKNDIENNLSLPKCECETIEINNCIEIENTNKIDINIATKEELKTLPGIGDAKAESIITYREENGDFKEIAEIKNISGLGEAIFENIKDLIIVGKS